jgi:Fuc2NAc and GlcNAc transferase
VTIRTYLVLAVIFLAACLLTEAVRRMALSTGMLDRPNRRSSHTRATPRGGGMAIVIATSLGVACLGAEGAVDARVALALVLGGLPIALIGFLDDREAVSAKLRFMVHVCSSALALALLGGVPLLQVGSSTYDLGFAAYAVALIAIVWTVNLFNFMDGIDGLAASEAIFVCTGGAVCAFTDLRNGTDVGTASMVISVASFGFLLWNWPPAKIFMGDVGSGFLGFVIAIMALAATRNDPAAPFVWLILGGVFFVDATFTLIRRMFRGERAHVAHRSHAYQWLARRWSSHLRVTLAVGAVNLGWLFPLAYLAQHQPDYAAYIAAAALAPLVVLALVIGAGRAEQGDS